MLRTAKLKIIWWFRRNRKADYFKPGDYVVVEYLNTKNIGFVIRADMPDDKHGLNPEFYGKKGLVRVSCPYNGMDDWREAWHQPKLITLIDRQTEKIT